MRDRGKGLNQDAVVANKRRKIVERLRERMIARQRAPIEGVEIRN